MPIPSSEVIARTVAVLEEICILLDEEIDERTHDPIVLPADALKCKDAQNAVQVAIAKLLAAGAALSAPIEGEGHRPLILDTVHGLNRSILKE